MMLLSRYNFLNDLLRFASWLRASIIEAKILNEIPISTNMRVGWKAIDQSEAFKQMPGRGF